MTEYDLFIHYYNDSIGKAVTNNVDCDWYPCTTKRNVDEYPSLPLEYQTEENKDKLLDFEYMNKERLDNDTEALEILYMSKSEVTDVSENTAAYEKYIISASRITNPKYDMIFVWDGLGYYISTQKGKDGQQESINQLYFDKMKRVSFKPWFFHSKYHSLKAVMTKAQELIDLFGKDHVMIGKEVDLKQYIDIV